MTAATVGSWRLHPNLAATDGCARGPSHPMVEGPCRVGANGGGHTSGISSDLTGGCRRDLVLGHPAEAFAAGALSAPLSAQEPLAAADDNHAEGAGEDDEVAPERPVVDV